MIASRVKLGVAMARACMNTTDLAQKAQMPRPTVNNVVTGRNVRPRTIGRIAKALDVDIEDILEGGGLN